MLTGALRPKQGGQPDLNPDSPDGDAKHRRNGLNRKISFGRIFGAEHSVLNRQNRPHALLLVTELHAEARLRDTR